MDESENGEPVEQPSSSQEAVVETRNIVKTISLIGTAPIICKNCESLLFTNDLTECPLCGVSTVIKAAIVHYVQPCEMENHDKRYSPSKASSMRQGYFRIPCQADGQGVRPKNLSASISAVTCPRCLHMLGAEIDENGKLTTM